MEIIEDRHGKCSTIIASQLPIKCWYEVIREQTTADPILDRTVHNAHRIELKGEALEKKQITNEDENNKNLIFIQLTQLFTLFKKQRRVVSLQRYSVVSMCVFASLLFNLNNENYAFKS